MKNYVNRILSVARIERHSVEYHIDDRKMKITERTMQQFFLILLLVMTNHCVMAADNALSQRYVVDGDLTIDAFDAFTENVTANSSIREVELRNSRGSPTFGNEIGTTIMDRIAEMKIDTYATGQCASSCANSFLMGVNRTMLPSMNRIPTHLWLHPVFSNKTGAMGREFTENFLTRILKRYTGAKEERNMRRLLKRIYEVKKSRGGILIFRTPLQTPAGAFYVLRCEGKGKYLPFDCEPIKDLTPKDLGISTAEN